LSLSCGPLRVVTNLHRLVLRSVGKPGKCNRCVREHATVRPPSMPLRTTVATIATHVHVAAGLHVVAGRAIHGTLASYLGDCLAPRIASSRQLLRTDRLPLGEVNAVSKIQIFSNRPPTRALRAPKRKVARLAQQKIKGREVDRRPFVGSSLDLHHGTSSVLIEGYESAFVGLLMCDAIPQSVVT
jgi:hypothetical protein